MGSGFVASGGTAVGDGGLAGGGADGAPLIDTHAHLDHPRFDEDREAVIRRAWEAGFVAIVTIGSDLASSERAVALAEAHDGVFAAVGIHPHDASGATEAALERLRQLAAHPKVVAIGEIGLDYYYDYSPRPVQRDVFIRQLGLARETGLPFVIHNREADADVMAVLRDYGVGLSGVLHAFTGDEAMAAECIERGYMLSAGGMVTFPKAEAVRDVIAEVPLSALLLETDAPYLTPVPLRGRRNEPAYTRYVAEFLARERRVSVEEVASTTTANAIRLFRLSGMQARDKAENGRGEG